MRSSVYSGMGKSPPPGLGRSHRQHVVFTIPWCNTDSYSGSVISALLLAGVFDPNCLPRHHTRPREFAYHAHHYHAPPPPARREPWPDPNRCRSLRRSGYPERAPSVCLWVSTLGQMDLRRASRVLDLACRM